ncbi:protein translocase subunit SecD [candidate division WWE3 bacterium CG_4_10_14_0_2_um_filter_42_7]|uniref:Protein translocase subunit SecD n=2 Tax=Katanobacteria TaxID=422282 RepID=A0A2H0X9C8_UNCKA|nr:MAG: protein translocase subunit SecD [candidate division WWE3 bacterium CG08_land_8_20_14_0_20_41_15]PIZ42864.1 MAG: protein translocase subunit SecD [candidate division WWE3 bacterium CG_4_10_14_0_2_um_filter_42_7]
MLDKLKRPKSVLIFILLLSFGALIIDLPKFTIKFDKPFKVEQSFGGYAIGWFGGKFVRDLQIKKGLDLQGGIQVTLQADMKDIAEKDRKVALESARGVLERRVNFFGVTEPNIQTSVSGDNYRILIELPGVTDSKEAIQLIGQTAQLDFAEQKVLEEKPLDNLTPEEKEKQAAVPPVFAKTDLSGKDLSRAAVTFDSKTGAPQISIEFTDEGAKKFAEITKRNVQKPLAIFLDGVVLTAPIVQEEITGGQAVITGQFTLDEAKLLSVQLNAGSLPVSISVLSQKNIGATLGEESLKRSLIAGVIGLMLVAIFMLGNYGRLGILADIALIVYGLITLALYKLIPVTLTLSGIAGFILSIGMAVDSNILIFERIKEERRSGKSLLPSMEAGFGRAWDSIRDANICTLITSFVLFNPFNWSFLNVSGMVRGFALTLALGIAISLFTGIVVTRTLVRVFYR